MKGKPSLFASIIQKMVLFDLGRKNSFIIKDKKSSFFEDENLFLFSLETILESICKKPLIIKSNATEILKNLVILVTHLAKEVPPTAKVYKLFIDMVNVIVCEHNSEIRFLLLFFFFLSFFF